MQKARRHCACAAPTACRRKVSGSVSLPCSGCFSPFPHGTGSLSVSREYLALPDGPGGFAQDFTCPALLRMPLGGRRLRVRASHPLWNDFPDTSPRLGPAVIAVLQPRDCIATATVWALPRSLATTGGIISLFSLPAGTKMFQFPAFASVPSTDDRPSDGRVVPFGNLRIKGHLHLPEAYRSLSRPSSPP